MDRDRISPPPIIATLALAGFVGAIWVAGVAGRTIDAHGYAWTDPSGVATLAAAAGTAVRFALAVTAALLVPWWLVARGSARPRSLGRIWGGLAGLSWWAWQGYHYNRFEVAGRWRESAELAGTRVPAALTDPEVWLHNAVLTGAAIGLAWILGSPATVVLRRRLPAGPRALKVVGWAGLVALLALAAGPTLALRPQPSGPDIILISLDAVRADRLGVYGYDRDTTPHLDRFASDATRFDRAYTQEPWTLTSHMSMLTGLYPDAHGLDFGRSLAPAVRTLAERLRDAGYRTHGTVYDCFLLNPQFGYAAGFDRYDVDGQPAASRVEAAADWLLAQDRPSFLFLHLYDPHTDTGAVPYEASAPYLERFAPGAAAAFADWTAGVGASEALRRFNVGERELDASLRTHLSDLYDASLAECDAAVGRFLDRLRAAGRYDDAVILILSDHGEALGERDHTMHEELMEATLRIPFLLKWPDGAPAGAVRRELVETVDVMPTLLEAAGLAPEPLSQGQSLRGPIERPAAYHRSGPAHAVSTDDGWRLHHRAGEEGLTWTALRRYGPAVGPADGPDVLADSLAVVDPHVEPTLRWHEANRAVARRFSGATVEMGQADEDLLRSLGYID